MPTNIIQKLFLDTNVILSGAYYPHWLSARLPEYRDDVEFVVSQRVIAECSNNILRRTQLTPVRAGLINQYLKFINTLNSTVVTDRYPHDERDSYENDKHILATAIDEGCDAICTYNLPDFRSDQLEVVTPTEALKRFNYVLDIRDFAQQLILGRRGSLLISGRLEHPGAFSQLLTSESGVKVTTTAEGQVTVEGPNTKMHSVQQLIEHGPCLLTLRYNDTNFYADSWVLKNGGWQKKQLCVADCEFGNKTSSPIGDGNTLRGAVTIRNISAIPHFVKDRDLPECFGANSMFARFGSGCMDHVVSCSESDFRALRRSQAT